MARREEPTPKVPIRRVTGSGPLVLVAELGSTKGRLETSAHLRILLAVLTEHEWGGEDLALVEPSTNANVDDDPAFGAAIENVVANTIDEVA